MSQYDFIIKPSKDYLEWRYLDPRSGNYVFRIVIEGNCILGFAVFRINRIEPYHLGFIVDLLTVDNRLDVAEALLVDVLGYFIDHNVNQVYFQVVEEHPFEGLARKFGFYSSSSFLSVRSFAILSSFSCTL
jgi:hypothetical protein